MDKICPYAAPDGQIVFGAETVTNPFAPLGMDRRGLETGAVTEVGLENSPEVSAGWDSRGIPGEGAEDETA